MSNRKPSQNLRRRSRKGDRFSGAYGSSRSSDWSDPAAAHDAAEKNVAETEPGGGKTLFIPAASPETLRQEKEKARALKKTRWWQLQLERGICFYCQKPASRAEATLDHIVPLIRGGRSTRGNVVLACKTCNSRKKYLLPMEWEEYLHQARSPAAADPAPAARINSCEQTRDE